jgi:LacI family transcriptional regulator/LacI family repressor for deo operon, udp, cdd, tsx, nupC, and nupG
VNHHGEKFHWENIPIYQEYFQGARERAANSGYLLEVFDVNLHGMKAGRLASILRAQNIRGILLCPQPHSHAEVEFPWENFSTVTIGYSLSKPQLHVAAATQYRNAVSAVKHLRSYGYQHIGYVVWPDFDQRSDSNYLAGYLAETFSQNKNLSMSSLVADYDSLEAFQAWYEKFRPDAIVTADAGILDKIKLMGLKVPRDLGVACFALSNIESPLAGIHENTSHIGAIALDFLIGMIHRGEQGIPEIPQRILIEGTWVHAPSLKKSLH